MDIYI